MWAKLLQILSNMASIHGVVGPEYGYQSFVGFPPSFEGDYQLIWRNSLRPRLKEPADIINTNNNTWRYWSLISA